VTYVRPAPCHREESPQGLDEQRATSFASHYGHGLCLSLK